mgnify:CR=1 FL=1
MADRKTDYKVRVPQDLRQRAQRLIKYVADDPAVAGRVTEATVWQQVCASGVLALEVKYRVPAAPAAADPK